MVFYKQVLPKAGLAKYSALDVQFEGQVVGVKRGPTSVVDSIQLQKNIEELMKKKDAEQEPDDITEAIIPKADPTSVSVKDSVANKTPVVNAVSVKTTTNPNPTPKKTAIKKSNPVKPTVKNQQKSNTQKPKPKAVMQARNAY
jgi:hypothetical protein